LAVGAFVARQVTRLSKPGKRLPFAGRKLYARAGALTAGANSDTAEPRRRSLLVKRVVVIAGLFCALPLVALAQTGGTATPSDRAAVRPKRQQLPAALPHEFAPPQEAYASFPENDPAAATSATPTAPSACEAGLAKVAEFKPLPILVGPGDCGADDAVLLETVTLPDRSKVTVSPAATLRCPMAQQIADWVRDDVAPTVKPFDAALAGLDNFASYDCRGRNNVRAAKVSEHGRADALDVRDFKLADGRELVLTDINADKDWRNAVRSSACARFMTVLGPGSDGYHEEHIHLDLEPRRNDYKICQWDVRAPPAAAQSKEPEQAQDSRLAQAEGVTLQGLAPPLIPENEVPMPRPRPVAANLPQHRAIK
jgi:hypothetical protein